MKLERVLNVLESAQFSSATDVKAKVIELAITDTQSVAVWALRPGQKVPTHIHPDGQDTWIVLKGEITYIMGNGKQQKTSAGFMTLAEHHQIHGAINLGSSDAIFVSIYSAPTLKVEPAAD